MPRPLPAVSQGQALICRSSNVTSVYTASPLGAYQHAVREGCPPGNPCRSCVGSRSGGNTLFGHHHPNTIGFAALPLVPHC